MASSISQMGILFTETGRAADAVPLNLRSLALRLEIGSPQVLTNLHWLSCQRTTLGMEAFRTLVAEHADAEGATRVLALLDQFEAERTEAELVPPPPAARASPRGAT